MNLLTTVYRNEKDLYNQVLGCIAIGADVNEVTEYGESALRVASNNGRFDIVRLLIERGANEAQLGWSALHYAVAFEQTDDLQSLLLNQKHLLEARDFWDRTPLLLSILTGNIQIASILLDSGADRDAVGRCGKTVCWYAIQNDDVAMLDWLVQKDFNLSKVDEFKDTPLIYAAANGKTQCVRYLVEQGVNIFSCNDIPERAIEVAVNMEIVNLLVERGEDINDVNESMHQAIIGTGDLDGPTVSHEVYRAERHQYFGKRNPEKVQRKFWIDMIKSGSNAWSARIKYDDEDERSPVWCYERFGRSTNRLPDGRVVEIAGEHEDSYDPDFCIYNDVVVFEPGRQPRIYCYPKEVFPPTDFHTATLVGNEIIIVGCLGYLESRTPDKTPVYWLCLQSMKISEVETTGELPGWISDHKAQLTGSELIVAGGEVWIKVGAGYAMRANDAKYVLNLETLAWSKC